MFTLGIVAVAVSVLMIAWGWYFTWGYVDRRQRRLAVWESAVTTIGPTTLVSVQKVYRTKLTRRVLETKAMAAISDTDTGWGDRLARAVVEADVRATELNARDM